MRRGPGICQAQVPDAQALPVEPEQACALHAKFLKIRSCRATPEPSSGWVVSTHALHDASSCRAHHNVYVGPPLFAHNVVCLSHLCCTEEWVGSRPQRQAPPNRQAVRLGTAA